MPAPDTLDAEEEDSMIVENRGLSTDDTVITCMPPPVVDPASFLDIGALRALHAQVTRPNWVVSRRIARMRLHPPAGRARGSVCHASGASQKITWRWKSFDRRRLFINAARATHLRLLGYGCAGLRRMPGGSGAPGA